MWASARHLLNWSLAVLLALAVGLAARPHDAPTRADLLLAAFALPDGTIPELCAAGDEDGAPKAHDARCALCVLAKFAVLGAAPTLPGRALAPSRAPAPLALRLLVAAAWSQPPPARGPPPASVA